MRTCNGGGEADDIYVPICCVCDIVYLACCGLVLPLLMESELTSENGTNMALAWEEPSSTTDNTRTVQRNGIETSVESAGGDVYALFPSQPDFVPRHRH